MSASVINGDRWIRERLAFLRETLEGDVSGDQRALIEIEIAALETERGISSGGHRISRFWRRWHHRQG